MLEVNQLIGFGAGGTSAHRWWRVRFTAPFYDGYDYYVGFATLREVEMRLASGGADQTLLSGITGVGGTPIASSESGSGPAYGAYDNSLSWSSGQYWAVAFEGPAGTAWIGWSFDEPKAITEIALEFGGYGVASLVIEYSDDGTVWTTTSTHTGPTVYDTGWKTYLV